MDTKVKVCCICKESRPLSEFNKDRHKKDGLDPRCRICNSNRLKLDYLKNKPKRLEARSRYREENKDGINQTQKEYYWLNKDAILKKLHDSRKKFPERYKAIGRKSYKNTRLKRLARQKEYYIRRRVFILKRDSDHKKSPEVREKQRLRYKIDINYREACKTQAKKSRAKRRGAAKAEAVNRKKVYETHNGLCYLCNNPVLFEKMHLDHKTPLCRGGSHTYDNIGCACSGCNLSKQRKTEAEFLEWLLLKTGI